ncbi:MAG: PA14 domain-containing protein [Planctomycetota bacterium]
MASQRRNKRARTRQLGARLERLEDRRVLATDIQVLAAGLAGTEDVALEIAGEEVRRWDNIGGNFASRQFQTLSYTHPTDVTADDIAVRFVGAGGGATDVRIDGVRVDGVKYESESPTTWNTGGWNSAYGAIAGEYGGGGVNDEVLFSRPGALYFSASIGSTVQVRAAGSTNTERFELYIKDQFVYSASNIGGDYDARSFWTYTYEHSEKVDPKDVRVAFTNDGTAGGQDRNLRVDAIVIDGRRYESESPATFSTGTWADGVVAPSFPQRDVLHANGSFTYSSLGEDDTRVGSTLIVWAAGATGEETITLELDGRTAHTVRNLGGDYDRRDFVAYGFAHTRALELDDVRIRFVNDAVTAAGDRNARIDAIELDGVRTEADDLTTYSTGTWRPEFGVQPGFTQNERLHANGYFQFGDDPTQAGTLGIGSTQYSTSETGGFVDIDFVRTGGSRGAVSIDYTTVSGDAINLQDFVGASGTLVFAEGQSSRTVRINILDDNDAEGTHSFNISADRVLGGAFLGEPRTATVSIFDDEAPGAGNGNGLLGEYFAGVGLSSLVNERTDATVNFNWGNGAPGGGVPADNFSVRWSGQLQPLHSQTYTFYATSDDGVRLWVNGQQIINDWIDRAPNTSVGSITLEAGQLYDIRMEYYERGGGAVARLEWASPSQPRQVIPTTQLYSEQVVSDNGQFVSETVISGLTQPTAIEFTEVNGQEYLFILQKDGRIRLAIDGVLQSQVFLDYRTPVNNVRDRGALGLEVHPDFPNTPYVYLLYTYDPPETQGSGGLAAPDKAGNRGSRLTRVTADASNNFRTATPGSDVVLLGTNSTWQYISSPDRDSTNDINLPPSGLLPDGTFVEDILITDSQSHTIGALAFAPDGSLYVSNGDGTSYGRTDPRTIRTQQLDNLSGKVLRIDPITGDGLSDNPFYTGDVTDDRSKIFNYGLRNPFRMAVNPANGLPYVGDVGWTSWEEINGGEGENFGWPFYEGGDQSGGEGVDGVNRTTRGYRDLPEAQAFYNSGGNAQAEPPTWSRSHGAGGVAVVMGDFYTGDVYPEQFQGAAFFTDYGAPDIRALTVNADGSGDQTLFVMPSVGVVIEMSMGPDGRMYYVDITGNIGRIDYVPAPAFARAATPQTTSLIAASPLEYSANPPPAAPVVVGPEASFGAPFGPTAREPLLAAWDQDDTPVGAPSLGELRVSSPVLLSEPEIDAPADDPVFAAPVFATAFAAFTPPAESVNTTQQPVSAATDAALELLLIESPDGGSAADTPAPEPERAEDAASENRRERSRARFLKRVQSLR